MRRFRCPHCGEECITVYKKLITKGDSFVCSVCGEEMWQKPKYENPLHSSYDIVIPSIIVLLISVMLLSKSFILLLLIAVLTLFHYVTLYLYPYLFFALVKQRDEHKGWRLFRAWWSPHDLDYEINATVELNNTFAVGNLDIYGIRFKTSTDNVKFHEAFLGDLVPTIFYKMSRKQKNPICVTIMKTQFIPDELLKVGSQFAVICNNKEITSGKIIKLL